MKFHAKIQEIKKQRNLLNEESEVVEELFNSAPAQQSMARRAFQKVAGSLGGLQSKTTNNLTNVYKKTWGEYTNYLKTQKGLGQSGQHSIENINGLLTTMGIDGKLLVKVKNAAFKNIGPKNPLDDKTAGRYIYTVLQNNYQKSGGYTPMYQLPTSL